MTPYIGPTLRDCRLDILNDDAIDAWELVFDRHADRTVQLECVPDAGVSYLSIHAQRLSVCHAEGAARNELRQLRELALQTGADSISDHLGLWRGEQQGADGHFAPPCWTESALDASCRNVSCIQNYFEPLPFFVETIPYVFRHQGEMTEAEFLSRLLTRTGCGWLCDLANVYANALNFQFDAYEFLAEVVPSAQRMQLHLSGIFFDDSAGMTIASQAQAIPDAVWELYRFALQQGRGKIEAVFVEREQLRAESRSWIDEIRAARRIAQDTYRPMVRV